MADRVAELEKQNDQLHKRLAQAEKTIEVQKKSQRYWQRQPTIGERLDRLISAAEELSETVGVHSACEAIRVNRATLYRRRQPKEQPETRKEPPNQLSEEERRSVLDILHSRRFVDKSPREVYAILLDEVFIIVP